MIISEPTEEELALFALFMDESGVDQMELTWLDHTNRKTGGLFRTWPIQMAWWRSEGKYICSAGSRSIGKTLSAIARCYAFPFTAAGEELVITAPDGDRLNALTDKVETVFSSNWVAKSMLAPGLRGKIKHRPFHINFANNARIMGRIPRHDGTGMQGTHPLILIQDEASTYPERGWKETYETLKQDGEEEGVPDNAKWFSHGVTMGPGNTFDDIIEGKQPIWNVYKLPAMLRPTWTEKERQDKIVQYGGIESIDFKRNVYGSAEGADATLLNLPRLMSNCVDIDDFSDFNSVEYYSTSITDANLYDVDDILDLVDPPIQHTQYKKVWMGMDYGMTTSHTCILVFEEEKHPKEDHSRLKLVSRIMLIRVPTEDQIKVLMHLMKIYKPFALSFDAHGVGRPAFEWLQKEVREDNTLNWMLDRIKPYSFSEKIVVDFNVNIEFSKSKKDDWKRAAIERLTADESLDKLRLVVDTHSIWLPNDGEVLGELKAVPRKELMTMDEYGRPKRKKGGHILDAFRFAILGWKLHPVEKQVSEYQEVIYEAPPMLIMDYF